MIGDVTVHAGDCLEVIRTMADCSIDSVVTDPPYALVSIAKRFGKISDADKAYQLNRPSSPHSRAARGFMGKQWDTGDFAHSLVFWAEVLRVLKPGGHLVAFGGSRTYHRLACAVEDAGFEIRDQLQWIYGQGFPKSHKVSVGWGTALKPAHEPIVLARKPLSKKTVAENVVRWGTGALNIDATRIATEGARTTARSSGICSNSRRSKGRLVYSGGLDNSRIGEVTTLGRWPANVCHDGSPEVLAGFPETKSGLLQAHHIIRESQSVALSGKNYARSPTQDSFGDSGSAARFFYCAKASKADRAGSKHPTVKPVALMRWLVRLITPPGGTVLDPFAGSGTTGEAAWREGFSAVLIEREAEYLSDIARRIDIRTTLCSRPHREVCHS